MRSVVARAPSPALGIAVVGLTGVITALARIGGDLLWLDAVGRALTSGVGVANGLPYAALPTDGWPNVPALAELVIHAVRAAGGDRGVLALHVACVCAALTVLARDARRHAAPGAVAALLVVLVIGASTTLLIIRVSLFSILLMPVLLGLLRAEAQQPSRRIWLVVPLLALWSNLHGAALLGVAVLGGYLLLSRLRVEPGTAGLVAAASLLALCLTPALGQTPHYYWRALHNEAAQQHVGLWARLSLHNVPDVLFLVAALTLLALAVRGQARLWEWAVLTGLAVLTATAARHGVWLLMAALAPAARGLRPLADSAEPSRGRPSPAVAGALLAGVLLLILGLARGPAPSGATGGLLTTTISAAGGEPVLAEGQLGEQLAAVGGRVWITNPLDAFRPADQRWFIQWSEDGTPSRIPPSTRVVLVLRDSPPARALRGDPRFREEAHDERALLFVRR